MGKIILQFSLQQSLKNSRIRIPDSKKLASNLKKTISILNSKFELKEVQKSKSQDFHFKIDLQQKLALISQPFQVPRKLSFDLTFKRAITIPFISHESDGSPICHQRTL